jgi:hypothetical protein
MAAGLGIMPGHRALEIISRRLLAVILLWLGGHVPEADWQTRMTLVIVGVSGYVPLVLLCK